MSSQVQALLRHDLESALLNHSGVHKEIEDSLQELSDVLRLLVPTAQEQEIAVENDNRPELLERLNEIVTEDLDQCLPMLQISSERLSALLMQLVNT